MIYLWFFLILYRLIFFNINFFIRFFIYAVLHCFFLNNFSINFMCVSVSIKNFVFFYYKFIFIEEFIKHDEVNY